jgi:hypothetical protein
VKIFHKSLVFLFFESVDAVTYREADFSGITSASLVAFFVVIFDANLLQIKTQNIALVF